MGTVLGVVYAADTIVAYKYYRDSSDWLYLGLERLNVYWANLRKIISPEKTIM